MIFTKKQIDKRASKRIKGFLEEVLSSAREVKKDMYEIDYKIFKEIDKKHSPPDIWESIDNLVESASIALSNKIEFRSAQEIELIRNICHQCDFFISNGPRCGVCGCFLKAKVILKNWNCPKDKW